MSMAGKSDNLTYIDAHCHLAADEFTDDLHLVIDHAKDAGLKACVVVSENVTDFERVLAICGSNTGFLYPCLGVHPVQREAVNLEAEVKAALPLLHQYSGDLVGIGEIGLDYTPHLCPTPADRHLQKSVFLSQLQVALQYDLPVNVHSRSAAREVVQLLKEAGATKVLLHNFAGKPSVAMEAVSLGYRMSFPPRVSERSERDRVLRQIPLENLCLETDSPALGISTQKRNEPAQIPVICEHIAKIKKLDVEVVAKAAFQNTWSLFDRISRGLSEN